MSATKQLLGPDRPIEPEAMRRVQEFLAKPYRMIIRGTPEEGYVAEAPDLPNCATVGSTPVEAIALLRDAMEGWLLVSLESGDSIPEPSPDPHTDYRGTLLLRVPESLHQQLAGRAHDEGISLDQMALALLAQGLGIAREQSSEVARTSGRFHVA